MGLSTIRPVTADDLPFLRDMLYRRTGFRDVAAPDPNAGTSLLMVAAPAEYSGTVPGKG